jgi:hypothetical protein
MLTSSRKARQRRQPDPANTGEIPDRAARRPDDEVPIKSD